MKKSVPAIEIDDKNVVTTNKLVRTARLQSEYYVTIDDPAPFIRKIKESNINADLFTFVQAAEDPVPKYDFHLEWDSVAILRITTYENWWKKQINDKTRNMVRKAKKSEIDIRIAEFNDRLVCGIKDIYDETPIRQGKRNRHYGKDFDTVKGEHSTFLDQSDFIAASYKEELVGFAKLTRSRNSMILMNIVGKNAHRDKAPMNALIAKAVEICASRNIPFFQYGVWSKRGLGDFKKHHAFERLDVPRYFVPLNLRGQIALSLKLHGNFLTRLPDSWLNLAAELRSKWYSFKYTPARR